MIPLMKVILHGFRSYRDQTVIEPFSPKNNVVGECVCWNGVNTLLLPFYFVQSGGMALEKAISSTVCVMNLLNLCACVCLCFSYSVCLE